MSQRLNSTEEEDILSMRRRRQINLFHRVKKDTGNSAHSATSIAQLSFSASRDSLWMLSSWRESEAVLKRFSQGQSVEMPFDEYARELVHLMRAKGPSSNEFSSTSSSSARPDDADSLNHANTRAHIHSINLGSWSSEVPARPSSSIVKVKAAHLLFASPSLLRDHLGIPMLLPDDACVSLWSSEHLSAPLEFVESNKQSTASRDPRDKIVWAAKWGVVTPFTLALLYNMPTEAAALVRLGADIDLPVLAAYMMQHSWSPAIFEITTIFKLRAATTPHLWETTDLKYSASTPLQKGINVYFLGMLARRYQRPPATATPSVVEYDSALASNLCSLLDSFYQHFPAIVDSADGAESFQICVRNGAKELFSWFKKLESMGRFARVEVAASVYIALFRETDASSVFKLWKWDDGSPIVPYKALKNWMFDGSVTRNSKRTVFILSGEKYGPDANVRKMIMFLDERSDVLAHAGPYRPAKATLLHVAIMNENPAFRFKSVKFLVKDVGVDVNAPFMFFPAKVIGGSLTERPHSAGSGGKGTGGSNHSGSSNSHQQVVYSSKPTRISSLELALCLGADEIVRLLHQSVLARPEFIQHRIKKLRVYLGQLATDVRSQANLLMQSSSMISAAPPSAKTASLDPGAWDFISFAAEHPQYRPILVENIVDLPWLLRLCGVASHNIFKLLIGRTGSGKAYSVDLRIAQHSPNFAGGEFAQSLLQLAIFSCDVSYVQKLIECGADVGIPDSEGNNALHTVVSLLTPKLLETSTCSPRSASADNFKHEKLLQLILQHRDAVLFMTAPNAFRITPLMLAIIKRVSLYPTECQANPDLQDSTTAALLKVYQAKVGTEMPGFNYWSASGGVLHDVSHWVISSRSGRLKLAIDDDIAVLPLFRVFAKLAEKGSVLSVQHQSTEPIMLRIKTRILSARADVPNLVIHPWNINFCTQGVAPSRRLTALDVFEDASKMGPLYLVPFKRSVEVLRASGIGAALASELTSGAVCPSEAGLLGLAAEQQDYGVGVPPPPPSPPSAPLSSSSHLAGSQDVVDGTAMDVDLSPMQEDDDWPSFATPAVQNKSLGLSLAMTDADMQTVKRLHRLSEQGRATADEIGQLELFKQFVNQGLVVPLKSAGAHTGAPQTDQQHQQQQQRMQRQEQMQQQQQPIRRDRDPRLKRRPMPDVRIAVPSLEASLSIQQMNSANGSLTSAASFIGDERSNAREVPVVDKANTALDQRNPLEENPSSDARAPVNPTPLAERRTQVETASLEDAGETVQTTRPPQMDQCARRFEPFEIRRASEPFKRNGIKFSKSMAPLVAKVPAPWFDPLTRAEGKVSTPRKRTHEHEQTDDAHVPAAQKQRLSNFDVRDLHALLKNIVLDEVAMLFRTLSQSEKLSAVCSPSSYHPKNTALHELAGYDTILTVSGGKIHRQDGATEHIASTELKALIKLMLPMEMKRTNLNKFNRNSMTPLAVSVFRDAAVQWESIEVGRTGWTSKSVITTLLEEIGCNIGNEVDPATGRNVIHGLIGLWVDGCIAQQRLNLADKNGGGSCHIDPDPVIVSIKRFMVHGANINECDFLNHTPLDVLSAQAGPLFIKSNAVDFLPSVINWDAPYNRMLSAAREKMMQAMRQLGAKLGIFLTQKNAPVEGSADDARLKADISEPIISFATSVLPDSAGVTSPEVKDEDISDAESDFSEIYVAENDSRMAEPSQVSKEPGQWVHNADNGRLTDSPRMEMHEEVAKVETTELQKLHNSADNISSAGSPFSEAHDGVGTRSSSAKIMPPHLILPTHRNSADITSHLPAGAPSSAQHENSSARSSSARIMPPDTHQVMRSGRNSELPFSNHPQHWIPPTFDDMQQLYTLIRSSNLSLLVDFYNQYAPERDSQKALNQIRDPSGNLPIHHIAMVPTRFRRQYQRLEKGGKWATEMDALEKTTSLFCAGLSKEELNSCNIYGLTPTALSIVIDSQIIGSTYGLFLGPLSVPLQSIMTGRLLSMGGSVHTHDSKRRNMIHGVVKYWLTNCEMVCLAGKSAEMQLIGAKYMSAAVASFQKAGVDINQEDVHGHTPLDLLLAEAGPAFVLSQQHVPGVIRWDLPESKAIREMRAAFSTFLKQLGALTGMELQIAKSSRATAGKFNDSSTATMGNSWNWKRA
ncbi:hypothetical protein BJ741DRAFT_630100 [Chytriomyces cf. hyalinus JEL632]|nr:hypothetical protein BJ741DRAFT_630100 [Chytriomyces cf. hyalinus JEL632]